jgi:hypothetical protein
MWNPLKMGSVEKRMLIAGVTSGIIYYGNLYAVNNVAGYPTQLKDRADSHLTQYGDMLGDVAPPLVLYVAEKVSKNTSMKEKLADMTLGSVLFSGPNLVKTISVQAAYQAGVDTRPAASAGMRMSAAASKYQISQPRVMPTGPMQPVRTGMGKYQIVG